MSLSWETFERIVQSMNTPDEWEALNVGSDLSSKILEARLEREIDRTKLSILAKVPVETIATLEDEGALPDLITVYRLVDALGLRIAFINK